MLSQGQGLPMMNAPAIFRGMGISHLAQSVISQVPVRSWAKSISLPSRWAWWGVFRICWYWPGRIEEGKKVCRFF